MSNSKPDYYVYDACNKKASCEMSDFKLTSVLTKKLPARGQKWIVVLCIVRALLLETVLPV